MTPEGIVPLVNPRGERVDLHLPMDLGVFARLILAAANEGFEFAVVEDSDPVTP